MHPIKLNLVHQKVRIHLALLTTILGTVEKWKPCGTAPGGLIIDIAEERYRLSIGVERDDLVTHHITRYVTERQASFTALTVMIIELAVASISFLVD